MSVGKGRINACRKTYRFERNDAAVLWDITAAPFPLHRRNGHFIVGKSRSESVEVVSTLSKRRSCRLSTVEGVSLLLGQLHNSFLLF